MVRADTVESSRRYLSTFRTHVLDPVTTAVKRAERERRELETEREAFEAFATRIREIPAVQATAVPSPGSPALCETTSDHHDLLRDAYEETVMDVSHYDSVYGESIGENVVAEYGPEFASLFDPSNGVSFTDTHQEALVEATHCRIEERTWFSSALANEVSSLRTARRTLESTLDALDSTVVPDWYHDQFRTRIDDLLEERQTDIGSHPPLSRFDGHDLCEYLYADEPWSYPVLTAIGRLLDSVLVRSGTETTPSPSVTGG